MTCLWILPTLKSLAYEREYIWAENMLRYCMRELQLM